MVDGETGLISTLLLFVVVSLYPAAAPVGAYGSHYAHDVCHEIMRLSKSSRAGNQPCPRPYAGPRGDL